MTQNIVTVNTAVITVPNRLINAGEYGAAYGHHMSHVHMLLDNLRIRNTMLVADQSLSADSKSMIITIDYTGKLGKHNQDTLYRMVEQGFITNINY